MDKLDYVIKALTLRKIKVFFVDISKAIVLKYVHIWPQNVTQLQSATNQSKLTTGNVSSLRLSVHRVISVEINKELINLGFSATVVLVCIFEKC